MNNGIDKKSLLSILSPYAKLSLYMEWEDMEKEGRHTVMKWHLLQIHVEEDGVNIVEKEPLYQETGGFIFPKVDTLVLFSPLYWHSYFMLCYYFY